MEPIKDEENGDRVNIQLESASRKSVASEVSVTFLTGDQFGSFEEISFAEIRNRPLSRGKKRGNENGDANCGDRKRFCSLRVDFIL